jgi:hypothetical protein
MTRLMRKPAVTFVLGAALVAAAFVGKAAFGASGDGQIHACYKASNGLLYITGVSGRAGCQPGDSPVDWSIQGPQGLQGPPGPAGADGKDGTNGTNGTSIVNTQLASGDPNCPYGGTAFTGAGGTTYACNGAPGRDGADGVFTGTFVAGNNSLSVTDTGISLRVRDGVLKFDGPEGRMSFDANGISIDSALNLLLKAATALSGQAGTDATLTGTSVTINGDGQTTLKSAGITNVQGGVLELNGNGRPVARAGDPVNVSGSAGPYPFVGTGTILQGSSTVLAGG